MTRQEFIMSLGATCANWRWSWSFVDHANHKVYFGAWEDEKKSLEGGVRIFSEDWQNSPQRRNTGFRQSKEHIDLILERAYRLFTFPQVAHYRDGGPAKLKSFEEKLTECFVVFEGRDCFAVPESKLAKPPAPEQNPQSHWEGKSFQVLQTGYERSPEARQDCLKKHGHSCSVCRFDFEATYGEIGREFIHVHHLIRVKDRPKPYRINGAEELRPVCPNCHAMLHKRVPPFDIEELQGRLRSSKRAEQT